jgi:hypothetical protein
MSKSKTISELLSKNLYVKDTWAEYADAALSPKHIIYRYDDKKGNRFYYFKNGEEIVIAAGATTVFGAVCVETFRLSEWKENNPNWKELLDWSSEYGTLSHEMKGDIMFHKKIDKTKIAVMERLIMENGGNFNTPTKDVLSFMKFQEDYQLTPLLIEASLAWQCPESGEWLAQTIDLLARMTVTEKSREEVQDGVYQRGPKAGQPRYRIETTEIKTEKILLIDFKSNFFEKEKKGFYETHKLQLQAAKLAVEQNFDIKVDDVYNFSEVNWQTEPKYTFYKWDLTDKDWEIWWTYWKLARLKDINKPQGKILLTEEIKNSNDFRFLTYEEYVKQILINDEKSTESSKGN